jgi:hypothetical protein
MTTAVAGQRLRLLQVPAGLYGQTVQLQICHCVLLNCCILDIEEQLLLLRLLLQVPDGPDGQTAELRRGDTMAIKYTTVKGLVEAGQVCLL